MKSSMIIHPEELSRRWIDKLAAAGVSTLGIHPVGGAGVAQHSLRALIEQMKSDSYRALGFSEIATFACYLGADYEALYGQVDITPFAACL